MVVYFSFFLSVQETAELKLDNFFVNFISKNFLDHNLHHKIELDIPY